MSTVGRALLILEDLGRQNGHSTLSEIARRTGLPKSTAHRLLADLESNQAVQRDGDRYRLGPRAPAPATARYSHLARLVMPCLVDLYQKVNLSVSLAVLRHQLVVYLVTLYGPGHSRTVLRTEVSAPAHCTAAGKALLAYCPVQADRYGRDLDLWPMTSHSITSQTAFTTELARIRAEGVAYNREEYVTGLVGVASPILRTTGRARAAIAVLGSTGQFDFEGVTRHLRRSGQYAAQLINRGALPYSDLVEC